MSEPPTLRAPIAIARTPQHIEKGSIVNGNPHTSEIPGKITKSATAKWEGSMMKRSVRRACGSAGLARGIAAAVITLTLIPSLFIPTMKSWGGPPPEPKLPPVPGDILAEDSEDFDGDFVPDDLSATPVPGGIAGCEPGEVYVTSGADGDLIVRFRGRTCNDQFGHGLAIIRDFNLDSFEDLLIGAPGDENGHAFGFLGPFRCPPCPLLIDAENADFIYFSPNAETYDFGERVSPVSDLDGDGIPELRIRAWFETSPGVEQNRTYIASGADGFPLLVVTGNAPFNPWATQTGDVDGDGDVDQLDLDIIADHYGITSGATVFKGDVDGDGDVDPADTAFATGFLGHNQFSSFVGIGDPSDGGTGPGGGGPVWGCQFPTPPDVQCMPNCWGFVMSLPDNVEPLCVPLSCQAWCGFEVEDHGDDIMPIDSYGDVYNVEAIHGLDLGGVVWEVLQGADLIDVISGYTGKTFKFHPKKKGYVQVKATNQICAYTCTQTTEEKYLVFLDSDYDSLPDAWENLWGLDPLDPTDAYEDNDADGLNNLFEFTYDGNPFAPDAPGDSDGDAIPDPCELAMGTDPFDTDDPPALLDTDLDGVVDAYEICIFQTNPFDADTDSDGMPDGWEIQYGLEPDYPGDALIDADDDGIPTILEYLYGSSPIDPLSGAPAGLDADGDGYIDWLEQVYGTSPTNPASVPAPSQLTIDPDDMSWTIVNEVVEELESSALEMCVGDCFMLHATGWASSWTVVQGGELLDEIVPDSPSSCISPKWCITGAGDIVIMSSTPSPGGPIVGFVHIHAVDDCDDPCELEITAVGGGAPPEMACVGEEITLSASPDPGNGPECQCTGAYQWSLLSSVPGAATFVGGTSGQQVTVRINSPGEIHISATQGDCAGGVETKAVALEVTFERYVADSWPLSDCPNNGGKRIFADALSPGESPETVANRRRITVKAQVNPPLADIPIYFKVFDVDDLSSDTAPLDPNGNIGNDNRDGASTGLLLSSSTDPAGVAVADFEVSMQPGDNYKLFASIKPDALSAVSQAAADGHEPLTGCAFASAMLTVWRHLWMEQDAMFRPSTLGEYAYISSGPVATITPNMPTSGLSTIGLGINLPDDFSDLDMYEGGAITFAGCGTPSPTYTIFSNTSHVLLPDEVVVMGAPAMCPMTSFVLRDDDVLEVLPFSPTEVHFIPHADPGTIGESAFADAYVNLEYLGYQYSDGVPFDLNLNDFDVSTGAGWNDEKDFVSRQWFWCHLVVACFQGLQNEDADADGNRPIVVPMPQIPDGAEFGVTFGITREAQPESAIYMETIRDITSFMTGTSTVAHTVTHEIGHGCGALHAHGGIMTAGAPSAFSTFTPATIVLIRSISTWGDY